MHHSYIDKFAYQDSAVHRLDSRVKFIAAIIYTAVVISLPRHSVSLLFCYAIGPVAILVIGKIPLRYVLKYIFITSFFIAVFALSSVFYDKSLYQAAFGPFEWEITGGWLRCFNIYGKFVITMLTLMALVSTTKFSELLAGLSKLGFPQILVTELGFLYRYIFLLIDKVHHMLRARAGRKLRYLGLKNEIKIAASMIGSLFIGSIKNAEAISIAMQARGFDGTIRTVSKLKISYADYVFAAAAIGYVLALQLVVKNMF